MSESRNAKPGEYASHRHLIDDPNLRSALLVQIRGTVQGLRSAFRWHVILSLAGMLALILMKPTGWLGEQRHLLILAALVIDVLAITGLRTVAAAPTRVLMPLLVVDLLVVGGMTLLSWTHGEFSLLWLLLLVLPVMLIVYGRDARIIAPILAEHARYREAHPGDEPPSS